MFNVMETPWNTCTDPIVLIDWVKHLGQPMLKLVPMKTNCPCKIFKSAKIEVWSLWNIKSSPNSVKKRRVPAWPLFVRFVNWHFPSSKTSMCCWYETLLLMTKKEKRCFPSPETFPVFSFTLYSDTKMETRNVSSFVNKCFQLIVVHLFLAFTLGAIFSCQLMWSLFVIGVAFFSYQPFVRNSFALRSTK